MVGSKVYSILDSFPIAVVSLINLQEEDNLSTEDKSDWSQSVQWNLE